MGIIHSHDADPCVRLVRWSEGSPIGLRMAVNHRLTMVCAAALFSACPAWADTCNLMSAGGISVLECTLRGTAFGTYEVSNNSGKAIDSFAVSTLHGADWQPYTSRDGWAARYLGEDEWNTAFATLTFDETFGTHDTGAYFFRTSTPSALPIEDGTTADGFRFQNVPESQFIAFDSSGSAIAKSYAAPVPETAPFLLMLAGLGVIAARARTRPPLVSEARP